MSAKTLMFMGTGSDVGKSLLVAGLCRAYKNRDIKVAPFKPQNMSNNAAVTIDGGEIGRAQALQAQACELEPHTNMNPILLKPERETGSQVIVRGKRVASMQAREYFATRQKFMPDVLSAFEALKQDYDLVLVEGAGSASEVNLRHNDLANFGFAEAANVPVALIGDIQRGGVIASLVGTFEVIAAQDAERIVATIVNKFQGDPALFETGQAFIAEKTMHPCFGPVPMFTDAVKLPAEDALALDGMGTDQTGSIKISVLRLSRIANFDDLDPLHAEPDVSVTIVQPGQSIPRDTDLVIIPGSKATIADLFFLRAQGWDIDLAAHVRAGGHVLGICGGYQMLGKKITDTQGIEGQPGEVDGLGYLNVATRLDRSKQLRVEKAKDAQFGCELHGYHMHMGVTMGPDRKTPFARVDENPEGTISSDGKIIGTYLHGIFSADKFRRAFLKNLGSTELGQLHYNKQVDATLDGLAAHLEQHLDLDALLALARA